MDAGIELSLYVILRTERINSVVMAFPSEKRNTNEPKTWQKIKIM